MSNKPQMVTGFNHNIKHNGQIYHVQTEDSGAANPHIITHLFVGGNILATKKTSYADIVHADNLFDIVRELMQEQHKAMLRNLINGVYDNIGSSPAGPAVASTPVRAEGTAQAAAQAAAQATPQATAQQPATQQPAAQQTAAQRPAAQRPAAQQPAAQQPATQQPAAQRPAAQQPATQQPAAQRPAAQQPAAQQPAAQQPAAQQPAAQQPVTLEPKVPAGQPAAAQPGQFPPPADEQSQAASSQAQPAVQAEATSTGSAGGFTRPKSSTTIHRPPAPERVPTAARPTTKVTLRPKNTEDAGSAKPVETADEPVQPTVQLPAAQAGQAAQAAAQAASNAPTVENMPAVVQSADVPPEVLAAQRLAEKPKPKDTSGPTIFGENLISEKSLDEVILGYLAGSEE